MKRSTGENLGRMTVSVGVASFPSDERVRSLNRASRLVPLRRQAQRPQAGHLRGRPGIPGARRSAGGLTRFGFAARGLAAARRAASSDRRAQSASSSGSSESRSGSRQYDLSVRMPPFVGYRNGPDCSTAKSATITSSVLRWINPPTAHPNILPSAKMPMPENIRRSLTGPNTANSSRMKSGSTATSFFLPRASAPPTREPRAKVWLGC